MPALAEDFAKLLAAIEQLSRGGTRSITIPNGDVPLVIVALRLAAEGGTK